MMAATNRAGPLPDLQVFDKSVFVSADMTDLTGGIESWSFDDKSSIFVLSSRFEGFGLVLAEAMSCGLPCISFDCPYGPRDIITNEEDGILVENGNIMALAKALKRLMADENLRQSMGEKAIINVARYDSSSIMNRWEELFSSL